ncbi:MULTISPECIES: hypothetical protein [Streptomyces]|uniref:DUF2304 family protein n=2 Tax=Streptomyces TaxID=1883 RepID=A0A3R7FJN0_9ACTN|nr:MULTISPECIES: hypothetical protein [Streptomyces]MZE80767.1 hypothetical protein [Streptomyces sp. SID5475]KNE84032.1 membrane protein [Streptomyces fradiae]OFA60646.1 hypothetical protein BEN35_01785 [Streptomyces fradiae]PQM24717.1 hypothetical protein Sfr7A_00420 [Streptomyces xinghaiensis]RKM98770.1 hypothetical protein SFRA_000420 [Streptomyces xinghaiensis]
MVISLSAVVVLLIIMIVLIKSGSLKAGPALVAILFGFFLASSGMAPTIQRLLDSLADTLNQLSF